MPQTSSTNQPHYPTWQLMGGAPLDGFLDPPNNTTFKVFLFKINWLLPNWNWKPSLQTAAWRGTGSNQTQQKANPTCRMFGPPERKATLLSALPSPFPPWPCLRQFPKGWGTNPKDETGGFVAYGDLRAITLDRRLGRTHERRRGTGGRLGDPHFRAAPSAPPRLRERVPGALRILRRERNDQLCAAFQMPSGSISWLS